MSLIDEQLSDDLFIPRIWQFTRYRIFLYFALMFQQVTFDAEVNVIKCTNGPMQENYNENRWYESNVLQCFLQPISNAFLALHQS